MPSPDELYKLRMRCMRSISIVGHGQMCGLLILKSGHRAKEITDVVGYEIWELSYNIGAMYNDFSNQFTNRHRNN